MPPAPTTTRALDLLRGGRAAECGFFFDFDGTLAAIQEDPGTVQPVPGVRDALRLLVEHVGRVWIVSARPAGFLLDRFADIPGLGLHGLYGLESAHEGTVVTDPAAAPWEPVLRAVAGRARRELPAALLVEDKRLTLAVHYRRAPELRERAEAWAAAAARESGLVLKTGRMVVELAVPTARDKGTVVREGLAGLASAWCFGDDLGDLAAFDAVRERSDAEPGFAGVRVAVANDEADPRVAASADVVLGGPEDVPAYVAGLFGRQDFSGGNR